jgi:hypothetical protein
MIHYSCDRCRRPIQADETMRYVVKMEIEATIEPTEQLSAEDEQDCLRTLDDTLERMEEEFADEDESIIFQRKRFDLCPECYRKFIKNPVGQEKLAPFGFSHN